MATEAQPYVFSAWVWQPGRLNGWPGFSTARLYVYMGELRTAPDRVPECFLYKTKPKR